MINKTLHCYNAITIVVAFVLNYFSVSSNIRIYKYIYIYIYLLYAKQKQLICEKSARPIRSNNGY